MRQRSNRCINLGHSSGLAKLKEAGSAIVFDAILFSVSVYFLLEVSTRATACWRSRLNLYFAIYPLLYRTTCHKNGWRLTSQHDHAFVNCPLLSLSAIMDFMMRRSLILSFGSNSRCVDQDNDFEVETTWRVWIREICDHSPPFSANANRDSIASQYRELQYFFSSTPFLLPLLWAVFAPT